MPAVDARAKELMLMALITGTAIALHNFPEGLATFVATAQVGHGVKKRQAVFHAQLRRILRLAHTLAAHTFPSRRLPSHTGP